MKITDTVYFNHFWEICEKPLASYYRAGVLAVENNAWFYLGEVKDYTMDNTLVMEGFYSDQGRRDGNFKFFYKNGKLMAAGKYRNAKLDGNWTWYYPNGNEQATVFFPDDENDFRFVKFVNEEGVTTLENGTGTFTWYSDALEWKHKAYIVSGSFTSGKRSNSWHFDYYPAKQNAPAGFSENYNKAGKFTGRVNDDFKRNLYDRPLSFNFSPTKFSYTERMAFDDLFKINGDSLALNALAYYLIEHTPTQVNLRYKIFDSAFAVVLRTLEHYQRRIFFTQDRNINSKLEFKIGTKGYFENINFTGDGLDSADKVFFPFLLTKFQNVEMPGDKNVGIETNYTIYCYSIDFKDVIPGDVSGMATKRLYFSFQPKEKFEKFLQEHKKEIKEEMIHNWRYSYYPKRN